MSDKTRRLDLIPIGLVSTLSLVLHLIAIRGFGLFCDELYYIACSGHLAWGFVDQPPLCILVLKKDHGLPKAHCPHNSYWFWGPPKWDGSVAIIMGDSLDVQTSCADMSAHFETVILAGTTHCDYCMPYENNRAIFLCRRAKFSIKEIWPAEKEFI